MPLKVKLKGIDALYEALSSLPLQLGSGVKVEGEANYIKAMVWDLGYITRVIKPGPKTMWSVNVFGDPKVLTITAPTGFIRVNRSRYQEIFDEELRNSQFSKYPIAQWPKLIETMMGNTARRCAEVIAEAAPIDSGELRESIKPALPGEPLFNPATTGTSKSDFFFS